MKTNKLSSDLLTLVSESKLDLPKGYFYSSLGFCLTDAIFSIGVLYRGVENTIERLSGNLGVSPFKEHDNDEMSLEAFLVKINQYREEDLAAELFENKQRTSTRSGIQKAVAVKRGCEALLQNGINRFEDVNIKSLGKAEGDFLRIKGQGTGISYKYFCMLAGDENLIKPDRMICRYVGNSLGFDAEPSPQVAEQLFLEAFPAVKAAHPSLTPRFLDYLVWNSQSAIEKAKKNNKA